MAHLDFVIRYHRDYEDAALGLARRLFARFDVAIDSLALTPTVEDDFSLLLNDQLLCSQQQCGRAPRVADVVEAMSNEQ